MHKIAFAGDLHKRAKDITTIEGYTHCNTVLQRALMNTVMELKCDHFISLGDWYDKGYASDVCASLADYDLDIEMSSMLNGKFYGLIGNHIRLGMDSNPELHIIQPHPVLKSRRNTARTEQIMKTPDVLRLHDVQISFMHHKKDVHDVLAYKPTREPWAKYHVALFHTPSVVPNAKLMQTNYGYNASSNTKIGEVMADVDLAIVGDIHTPLGQFEVMTPKGNRTMIVPGSLTNVDASEASRHTTIAMPILTITDDSAVTLQFQIVDLKTNLLTFKKKNIEASKEKLKSLRGKPVENLHDTTDIVAMLSGDSEVLLSLNAFMLSQGYTDKDKNLIRSVINNPKDLDELVKIYTGIK